MGSKDLRRRFASGSFECYKATDTGLQGTINIMGRTAVRILALLLAASALAGCDKCADYFIANPFAIKPAGTCQSGAIPAQK